MRFSFARRHLAALLTVGSLVASTSLEAGQPRIAGGSSVDVVRTAHRQAEEAPPRPKKPAPPAAASTKHIPLARPMGEAVEERVESREIYEHEGHIGHDMGHGPGMDFNDSCLGGGCGPCRGGPIMIKADYIMWWRSGMELPPLVTTAPAGTAQGDAGEIGRAGTSVLFGGEDNADYPTRPGGRVELGWWANDCETFGLGSRFYWLGDAELTYSNSSTGSPILAIPFTEGFNNTPAARLVGFPGVFAGNLEFRGGSEVVGGDVYGRMQWCCGDWGRLDLLAGYQFARINEGLVLDSTVTDIGGATNRLTDTFDTRNEFHGGQIGLTARIDRCCYYVDLLAKVGLGDMQQTIDIRGQSVSTVGTTQSVLNNSGLFAQPTNVGTFTRSEFSAIPEFGANVGWHITPCIDLNVGYTAIFFSNIVRPGDVIDTTVNTTQIGGTINGAQRPAFVFNDSDLVVHGFNLGVTVKW